MNPARSFSGRIFFVSFRGSSRRLAGFLTTKKRLCMSDPNAIQASQADTSSAGGVSDRKVNESVLRRAADEFLPAVAEVAKTFGPSTSGSKLLASSATGKFISAARLKGPEGRHNLRCYPLLYRPAGPLCWMQTLTGASRPRQRFCRPSGPEKAESNAASPCNSFGIRPFQALEGSTR